MYKLLLIILIIVIALILIYLKTVSGGNEERWAIIGSSRKDKEIDRWDNYTKGLKHENPNIKVVKFDKECEDQYMKQEDGLQDGMCYRIDLNRPRLLGTLLRCINEHKLHFDKIIFDRDVTPWVEMTKEKIKFLIQYLKVDGELYIPIETAIKQSCVTNPIYIDYNNESKPFYTNTSGERFAELPNDQLYSGCNFPILLLPYHQPRPFKDSDYIAGMYSIPINKLRTIHDNFIKKYNENLLNSIKQELNEELVCDITFEYIKYPEQTIDYLGGKKFIQGNKTYPAPISQMWGPGIYMMPGDDLGYFIIKRKEININYKYKNTL